MSAIYMLLCNG